MTTSKASKPKPKSAKAKKDVPFEVASLRANVAEFFKRSETVGRTKINVGQIRWAVYAFFDYDGEPVYVGQTKEGLSVRVGRHLTGQRSDAVPHALTAVLVSDEVFKLRSNRDTRAARRAQTIASQS